MKIVDYPTVNSELAFSAYLLRCREIIASRRTDLTSERGEHIIEANSPYELFPAQPIYSGEKLKYGVLLIHGLFDCPFSLRDLGYHFQANGIFCRSILLPGHGTKPSDLLTISYHDWIQAVRYGVQSLKDQVDKIILVGYSTGAALSIYHALHDTTIDSIIMLAPAIRIKAPVDIVFGWHYLIKKISNNKQWIFREDEIDYTKYLSIAFNPVTQVTKLTEVVDELHRHHRLNCPIFMAVSREDETISSHMAIDFFSSLHHPESHLRLYTAYEHKYADSRIETVSSLYPDLNIRHLSHVSLPFAAKNSHYGQEGDFPHASHISAKANIYGAYNRIEVSYYELLYKLGLIKQKRCELTYNPDFENMANKMVEFVLSRSGSLDGV